MTYEGRAVDGGPLLPGDTFLTASGRQTTPFPQGKGARRASTWLIANAHAEACARGDDFNATQFAGVALLRDGTLTQADGASLNEYLFGQQPKVVPKLLNPMTSRIEAPR